MKKGSRKARRGGFQAAFLGWMRAVRGG